MKDQFIALSAFLFMCIGWGNVAPPAEDTGQDLTQYVYDVMTDWLTDSDWPSWWIFSSTWQQLPLASYTIMHYIKDDEQTLRWNDFDLKTTSPDQYRMNCWLSTIPNP